MRTKYIFSVLLLWLMALGHSYAQLDITWPANRMVFQRNGENKASVYFAGQFFNGTPAIQYRTEKLNAVDGVPIPSTLTGWTNVSYNSTTTPTSSIYPFMGSFQRDAGWYRLDIQAGGGTIKSVFFGVGDVYVVAGQSNSSGYSKSGDSNLVTFYDDGTGVEPEGISIVDTRANGGTNNVKYEGGKKRIAFPVKEGFKKLTKNISNDTQNSLIGIFPTGLNSWCYAALGKKMITSTNSAISNIPVAFFNAGEQGTWVENWTDSFTGQQSPFPFDPPGGTVSPYLPFRNTLQMFGNIMGVRAILWHQGESDSEKRNGGYSEPNGPTPSFDFAITKSQMESLLERSRQDFKNDLKWAISKVSWWRQINTNDRRVNPELRNRQGEVAGQSNNRLGAETDIIGMQDPITGNQTRASGAYNVHFSGYGLKLLADKWFDSKPWEANPISGTALLPIELVANNTNDYTLKGPSNVNGSNVVAHLWFRGSDLSNPIATTKDVDVSGFNNDIYTCYLSFESDQNKRKFQACQPVFMKANNILGGGCSSPPNLPTNLIANQGTISSGQTSILSASCGNYATPKWSTGALSGSIAVTPTTTTTYMVKCESNQYGSSCSSSDVPLTVTVNTTTGCTQTNLSSLTPSSESFSYTGKRNNLNISGQTLTVGGYQTNNGVGVHANSTLVYPLNGQYSTFSGSVGRDDAADNCGCGTMKLQFIIKADGATLFTSNLLGTADGKQAFSVNVAGKNNVELIVNDGGDQPWGDHADWLDAILYCGTPPTCTTAPPVPTNVNSSPQTIGSGGNSTLSATCATGVVVWNTGQTANSITVSPTITTSYNAKCVSGSCPASNTVSVGVTVNSSGCSGFANGTVMGTWTVTGQPLVARFFHGQYWLTQRAGTNPDVFVVRGSGMLQRSDVSLSNGSYYNMVNCFAWTYSDYGSLQNPPSTTFPTPSGYSLSYSQDGTMIYTANSGGGSGSGCTDTYVSNNWASATIGDGSGPKIGQNYQGGTMNINGTTYSQGIGTHAGSEIVYNLGSHSYANFKASVGRDVSSYNCNCGGQTIVFKVYNHSTGALIGSSTNNPVTKTINQSASDMVVPISGVSSIRLVVEDGGDQIWGDWANWGKARFTCAGSNFREAAITPEEWFWVSPNPNDGKFIAKVNLKIPQSVQLYLSDIKGNIIKEYSFVGVEGINNFEINIQDKITIESIYNIRCQAGEVSDSKRVIIEK